MTEMQALLFLHLSVRLLVEAGNLLHYSDFFLASDPLGQIKPEQHRR